MKILIHAVPERMWYVNGYLVPELKAQGAEVIEIWNDEQHTGNLPACMDAFASRNGDGCTWHLQDDVLPRFDFVDRCRELDDTSTGVVYGFCCTLFGDRKDAAGTVYSCDAWNSFQCIRIPDAYARDCSKWVRSGNWKAESPSTELPVLYQLNKGDDTFFHEYMQCRHPYDAVENVKPNLVEHVDWIVGGSTLAHWRDYLARADLWEDNGEIDTLKNCVQLGHLKK